MAARDEVVGEMRADEAGAAGDQDVHVQRLSPKRSVDGVSLA
jgi:hypothetical protein